MSLFLLHYNEIDLFIFQITKTNLTKLAKECNSYLSMKGPNACQAVSFGTWYMNADKSIRINLDYSGVNDVDTLVNHVTAQLRDVIKNCVTTVFTSFRIILAFPLRINANLAEVKLKEYMGERNLEIESFRTTGTCIVDSKRLISKL